MTKLRIGLAKRRSNGPLGKYISKRKRYTPIYKNNLMRYLLAQHEELLPTNRSIPESMHNKLSEIGMNRNIFNRIALNKCLVSLDEMFLISKVLDCSMQDII